MADALIRLPWGIITTVIIAALSVGGLIAQVNMLAETSAEIQIEVKALEVICATNDTELKIIKYRVDQITTDIGKSP